jgi:hypothetical protein
MITLKKLQYLRITVFWLTGKRISDPEMLDLILYALQDGMYTLNSGMSSGYIRDTESGENAYRYTLDSLYHDTEEFVK